MRTKMVFKDFKWINLNQLKVSPRNIRKTNIDREKEKLKESIRKKEVLDALVVIFNDTDQVYEIIKGQRRFLAARDLKNEGVPIFELPCIVKVETEIEQLEESLTDEIMRASVETKDVANAIRDLCNYYKSKEKAAEEVGFTVEDLEYYLTYLSYNPAAPVTEPIKKTETAIPSQQVKEEMPTWEEVPEAFERLTLEERREAERIIKDPFETKDPGTAAILAQERRSSTNEYTFSLRMDLAQRLSDIAKENNVPFRRLVEKWIQYSINTHLLKMTNEQIQQMLKETKL